MAVACFQSPTIQGEVVFTPKRGGLAVVATFTKLPKGEHGFHIHKAGDLRGEGCKGACDHYHVGAAQDHGGPPNSKGPRHTGDLGNVTKGSYSYMLHGISVADLLGRSIIVHADKDDLGKGNAPDSLTTGHSGARIACAIIGRAKC